MRSNKLAVMLTILYVPLVFSVSSYAANTVLTERRIHELYQPKKSTHQKLFSRSSIDGTRHFRNTIYKKTDGELFKLISKGFSETRTGEFPFGAPGRP